MDGRMDSVSLRYSFCSRLAVWMDRLMVLVCDIGRKEGWMDGWINVSLR